MMGLEQQIANAQVGGPLTTDGPNWGLRQFPVHPGPIFERVDAQDVSEELTGYSGAPAATPGQVMRNIDLPMSLRTGTLAPIVATFMGKPTVTQDGTADAYNLAYSLSDATADAVSMWGLFHKGGSTYPLVFSRARFGELSFESSGTGEVMLNAKGAACLDTEHGIGEADSGNAGGYSYAPVIMGDRGDAARLTDTLYVKVDTAPSAGTMLVVTKLGGGSYSTETSSIPYSTVTGKQTAWAELFNDSGALGFDECENRSQVLAFFPGKLAGFVAAPSSAPVAALASPAVAGSVTAGTHKYKVTFTNALGETTPSAESNEITVVDAGVNGKVNITGIPLGEPGTTSRILYRTEAAGSTFKLLATIADNTTTTYLDNIADGSLGADAPVANDAAVEPAVGDIWEFPALAQIPGTAAQGGDTTVARESLTGCRFGPAHVTIKRGSSSADTALDFEAGSVKLMREIVPAFTHGAGARNPYDMDVVGYVGVEVEFDRRFDSRELERLMRTNDRYVVEVTFEGPTLAGSGSGWKERFQLSIPQARIDKTSSPLTGPGITKEKVTVIAEQKSDGSPVLSASIRTATEWSF